MNAALRILLAALATGALAGCYQPGPYADPVGPPGSYVEGHLGQNGFWVPGTYQRGTVNTTN